MLFTARETFGSSSGESWSKYIEWLGRHDLTRVVTLDTMLCPAVIDHDTPGYWEAVVMEDETLDFFSDLAFVKKAVVDCSPAPMLLAVLKDPKSGDVTTLSKNDWTFAGFDLIDLDGDASALLNCGGFPTVFSVAELSSGTGLINSLDRAYEIQAELRRQFPDERHADCDVWGIWLVTTDSNNPKS